MDRVRIAIIDANNTAQLAFMDNGAREALHYYDDVLHTYLQGSAYTFECKVEKDHPDAQYIQAGNKLSFVWKQTPYNLTIMQTHEDESCIELTAYACCFELLNETAIAYTASSAMTLAQYLAVFLPDNDFVTVGINEASSYTRKLEWTGDNDSILKRLYSLASSFDAELEVIPTLNPDYTLGTIVLNFYLEHSDTQQGIGENRSDVVLRYGVDVEGISRDVDVTELYTAILPTGKDGLTLRTYAAQTVLDDDGNVLYQKPANDPVIYAPQARERYPSNVVAESDRYILYRWGTDYTTQASLYGNALTKLKSICEPKATYEVKGYTELNIGDTVMIVDDGFDPVLYLSARVVEQQISFTDKSRNETTFDNVTEMVSQIDDSLLARVQELASQVAQSVAGATVQYYVSTSPTELIGGEWSTTSPTWTDGSYIWTRTQFTANDGTVTYSNPACSTGAAGEDGQPGADGKTLFGTCSTASGTAAKEVVCSDATELYAGLAIVIKFSTYSATSAVTLNVNGLGAKNIYFGGANASSSNRFLWAANAEIQFIYNGSAWVPVGHPCTYFGNCPTAGRTAAKTVNILQAVVCKGTTVNLQIANANTAANATLNVSSTGARSIYANGAVLAADSPYNWIAGATVSFTFDGQFWRMGDTSAAATAAEAQDAADAAQSTADQKMRLCTSSTAAATAAKVATLNSGTLTLAAGATVQVTFTEANTAASPTLNVGGTGAKPIITNGVAYAYWEAGGTVIFTYDGTNWQVCSSPVYANTATIGNPAGGNVFIDADSVDIRDGDTVLSQFSQNEIGFYLSGLAQEVLAKIRFYDDNTQMAEQDTYLGYYRTDFDNLVLKATRLFLSGAVFLNGYSTWFEPKGTTDTDDPSIPLSQIIFNCGSGGYASIWDLIGQDYIIERGVGGTNNMYTYEKWQSGKAVCYGTFTVTVTSWAAWGVWYEGKPYPGAKQFPTNLFTDVPMVWASCFINNGSSGGIAVECGAVTKSQISNIVPIRPNAGSSGVTYRISVYAIGTWK